MPRKDTHLTHRIRRAACIVSAAVVLGVPCVAAAQAAAPAAPSAGSREIPRPDELEPGVNTTPAAPAAAAEAAAPAAEPQPAAASAPTKETAAPARQAAESPAAKPSAARQSAAEKSARKGPDRLELDATDITGNRELPKVMYIVPWKRSDLGDVVGRPVNSLLDEVLQPLDRDVFQRENRYYDALKPGAGDAKAGTARGSQTKP
jgi:type IV secretory pathway VirB10-like protein